MTRGLTDIYTEQELVLMAQKGNLEAEEALMRKYKEVVKIKSNYYYMVGADEEDIVQEGMIGLLKAIRQYDEEKQTSFSTFAGICITRQIIDAIRIADREKHKALNTSVSLSKPLVKGNEDITVADTLRAETAENPESFLVVKDLAYYIMHNEGEIFSDFEMQVLAEIVKGRDYEKIAAKLGKNYKSIDNAMQRIKKKIVNYILE